MHTTTSTPTEAAILVPSECCVIREQRDKFLVYNSRTDELHLVSPTGYYLYSLCDGLNDVGTICAALTDGPPTDVLEFLASLLARGILKEESAC